MRDHTGGSMGDLFSICSDPEPPIDDQRLYYRIPDSYTPPVFRFEEHSLVDTLYKMAKAHQRTKCRPDDMVSSYPELIDIDIVPDDKMAKAHHRAKSLPNDMVSYPELIDIHIVPDDKIAIAEDLSRLTVNDPMDIRKLKAKSLDEPEAEFLTVQAGLDYLHAIRNGPTNNIGTDGYNRITKFRTAKGVEQPETGSIDPPCFIPYNELADLRTQPQGSPGYLSQWEQYNRSPETRPVVICGNIELLNPSHHRNLKFDPEKKLPFPATVRNPMGCYQFVFHPNWGFQTPEVIEGQDKEWLFHRWLSRLPETAQPQDIFHHAFFDGTASADGGCGFMIQGIHHIETPRDMSDNETRRHWHETAAGYAADMIILKKLWSIQRDSKRYDKIMDEFVKAYDIIVEEFAQD
ncbi:Acyl-CoA N-acyltransferase [Penicillium longicatenatum]|nr:Acyl-CoA N-acyltransferase [Penicillium longicatenatum]